MRTEQQIIAEELAKHGVTPKSSTPVNTDVEEVKPKAMSPQAATKAKVEPKVTSAVEPKKTKVSIQLTDEEVAGLSREANLLGITWQDHLGTLVLEMLDKRVAKTLITGPSYATKKITGPSKIGGHYLGA